MRANSMCIACITAKQEKRIRQFCDEDKKSRYMHRVLELLCRYGQSECTPWIAGRLDELYKSFWGKSEDYTEVKHRYNRLLLDKETELAQRIAASAEPIRECIQYVCAANYIDFSAVEKVNEHTFETLLEKAGKETIPEAEYQEFRKDLDKAHTCVYLLDNCGEIVLDKLFIRFLLEACPQLQITAVVRGKPVLNDAVMEDAEEVGLTSLVTCIGNGSTAPGTVVKECREEVQQLLQRADLIISKGQGNFESLFAEGLNPYYMFLCKCELFVRRFGLERYTSVFVKEERVKIHAGNTELGS